MAIGAAEIRAARAALKLGVRDLADLADVSPNTIARLERGEKMHPRTIAYLQGVLMASAVSMRQGRNVCSLVATHPNEGFAKLFDKIWSLPNFRRRPEAGFFALLDIFEGYLDIMHRDAREPDVWERLDLDDARKSLEILDLFGASAYLQHAITPPDDQSPDYPIPSDDAEKVKGCDLAYFRHEVTRLRRRGYGRSEQEAHR